MEVLKVDKAIELVDDWEECGNLSWLIPKAMPSSKFGYVTVSLAVYNE